MSTPADLSDAGAINPPPMLPEEASRVSDVAYQQLREKLEKLRPSEDLQPLDQAYSFAKKFHEGQTRADGQPYITHPIEVAGILVGQNMDMICLTTALLHDVLEDTECTAEDIRKTFGDRVLTCVEGVTKIGKIKFYSREDRQAESVRKMLLSMVSDIRVIIVKFADRLHNIRTLGNLPREKQVRIAQETLEIYCPIAHRLGMGKIRAEMEDYAFRYLEPEAFIDIVEKVKNNRNASEEFLHQIKAEVEEKLKAEGIPTRVEARLKRPYSVWQKMKRQKIGIDQVYDLLALRIITDSVKNCYAALGVLHAEWSPIFGRIKDFIALPRPNLYQSLHTSVMVPGGQMFEVQIRTEEMHRIAEDGIAAHWKYKEGRRGQNQEDHRITWLRQLVEWQREMRDPAGFMSTIRMDLQQEDVFVFSPQGRVIMLTHGSTPVDFAYAIHSDVGNTCVGAKVNGRIVPLKYQLQNGEVVEIITQNGHKPSKDWLAFVKTGKARSKIKHFVSETERVQAMEIGQKYLETEARRSGVSLSRISKAQVEAVTSEYGVSRMEDLYAQLGYGRYSARQILAKLAPHHVEVEKTTPAPKPEGEREISSKDTNDLVIRVKGIGDSMTFRGKCCNPIPGERIVGYVTRGRGVAVHSVSCKNVQNLMYEPERKIEVEWARSAKEDFEVKLQILTDDRPGLLAQFTSILADENCNIRSLEAHLDHKSTEQSAIVDMTIEIRDKKQLDKLTSVLRRVSGVRDVNRLH